MSNQEPQNFFEVSRDFHRKMARHNRVTSLYYELPLAIGSAAVSGAGVYLVATESDKTAGLVIAGLAGYAAKIMGDMSLSSWRSAQKFDQIADIREQQLEQLTSEISE